MPQEINRVTSVRRITNPDDASTYIDVEVIDEITFIDPTGRNQQTTWTFDNSDQSSRQAHIVTVNGSDGSSSIQVERVDEFRVIDPKDRHQETRTTLDNAGEARFALDYVPAANDGRTTHDVRIYSPGGDEWLLMRRTDSFATKDPMDHNQEMTFKLDNKDLDAGNPPAVPLAPPTTTWDGTTINPPWRLDPFQNIVDVTWVSAVEFPSGAYINDDATAIADSFQFIWSGWIRCPTLLTAVGGNPWALYNTIFATEWFDNRAWDWPQWRNGLLIQANVGSSSGSYPDAYELSVSALWPVEYSGVTQQPQGVSSSTFRSFPKKFMPGVWHHALISADLSAQPAVGTPTIGADDFSGNFYTLTNRKFNLWIDGVNQLCQGSIRDETFSTSGITETSSGLSLSGQKTGLPIAENFITKLTSGGAEVDQTRTFTPSPVDLCQVQCWFGKYIDPGVNNNVAMFIDILTRPGAPTTITPALLDQAAESAYVAAGIPRGQWLSKAAAPNNLGAPNLYFAGGPAAFVNNRGSGGLFSKSGVPIGTGGPQNVPYGG